MADRDDAYSRPETLTPGVQLDQFCDPTQL
jgi:hypothetical protein